MSTSLQLDKKWEFVWCLSIFVQIKCHDHYLTFFHFSPITISWEESYFCLLLVCKIVNLRNPFLHFFFLASWFDLSETKGSILEVSSTIITVLAWHSLCLWANSQFAHFLIPPQEVCNKWKQKRHLLIIDVNLQIKSLPLGFAEFWFFQSSVVFLLRLCISPTFTRKFWIKTLPYLT